MTEAPHGVEVDLATIAPAELPLALQRAAFALAGDPDAVAAGVLALNDQDAPSDPILIELKAIRERLTRIEKVIGPLFED